MLDSTRQLVAQMRSTHRGLLIEGCGAVAAGILAFALIASLAPGPVEDAARPPAPPPSRDIDVVSYELPHPSSVISLTWQLWESSVKPHEVLRYNPSIDNVSATLPAGTIVRLPNHRDFPLEDLAPVD